MPYHLPAVKYLFGGSFVPPTPNPLLEKLVHLVVEFLINIFVQFLFCVCVCVVGECSLGLHVALYTVCNVSQQVF